MPGRAGAAGGMALRYRHFYKTSLLCRTKFFMVQWGLMVLLLWGDLSGSIWYCLGFLKISFGT